MRDIALSQSFPTPKTHEPAPLVVNVTFGAVRGSEEVIKGPQLPLNDIVVPLERAPGNLTATISSPIQVHEMQTTNANERGPRGRA